jgi:hypothetical protein
MVNLDDLRQHKNKFGYYYNFETWFMVRSEVKYESWVRRVNIKIKVVIIVTLKPNLEVNLGQGLGHELEGSTHIGRSQWMNKSNYYYSIKT